MGRVERLEGGSAALQRIGEQVPVGLLDLLEKPDRTTNIDAAVALAMAVDAHSVQPRRSTAARMALTHCLGCGALTSDSYCRRCNWRVRRRINTGWEWGQLRAAVHRRDRVCVRCGSTHDLQVHHRIPLVDGGSNELDNLELLCARCHRQVGAMASTGPTYQLPEDKGPSGDAGLRHRPQRSRP
jgi:5-methylcytosine-specific restriction endonuclease McrA